MQYTCFELDTVNIDWWICMNSVSCIGIPAGRRRTSAARDYLVLLSCRNIYSSICNILPCVTYIILFLHDIRFLFIIYIYIYIFYYILFYSILLRYITLCYIILDITPPRRSEANSGGLLSASSFSADYIYIYIFKEVITHIYIYIYIHMYMCICVYIYIYTY